MEKSRAGVISSVEPVAATLFGIVFYDEYPLPSAILGIALVISDLASVIMDKSGRRYDSYADRNDLTL